MVQRLVQLLRRICVFRADSRNGDTALRVAPPCGYPLYPVLCLVLDLGERRRDVGVPSAPAVCAMAPCLPTGASMGLAGQQVPAFAVGVRW